MIRTLVALSVFAVAVFAQPRVSLENQGTHVLCVVPMVGTGTPSDPMRPMFTPQSLLPSMNPENGNGLNATAQGAQPAPPPQAGDLVVVVPKPPIIAMQYQLSDDGKLALVDFVGSDLASVQPILSSKDPNVKACFLRDTSTKTQLETAFKQYKASFTLDSTIPSIAAVKAAQAVAK